MMDKLANKVMLWIGSTTSIIVHTIIFAAIFYVGYLGLVDWPTIMLVLTTAVSLEAIYLALFIQIAVNRNTASLQEVEEDLDEIQDDLDDIEEDLEDLDKDIEDLEEDIEEWNAKNSKG